MSLLPLATVASIILSASPAIATPAPVYRFSSGTIGVDFDDGEVLPLKVRQADRPALLPSAKFSIFGRESRFVGELGSSLIVADNRGATSEAEENFVLLAVNHQKQLVTGVVGVPGEKLLTVSSSDMVHVLEEEDDEVDEFRRLNRIRVLNDVKQHTKHSSHIQLQLGEDDILNNRNSIRKAASLPTATTEINTLPKVINLYLEIDRAIIENNGMTLCNTFEYVNSLVTASNSILEPQLGVVVNVPFVNQAGEGVHDLEYFDGANLHYSLSGSSANDDGETDEEGSEVSISCGQVDSSGSLSGMRGSFESLNEDFFHDVEKFVKAIGRSVASAPANISCLSTSVANPPTEDMIYGDEQCFSPNLPHGNPVPMPSQAADFSYDVLRIRSPTIVAETSDFNHLKQTRGGSKSSKDNETVDSIVSSPSLPSAKSAKTESSDDVGINPPNPGSKTGKSKKSGKGPPLVPPPTKSPTSSPTFYPTAFPTFFPTASPTLSLSPSSSLAPSTSSVPTSSPSVSLAPSESAAPSNVPSVSSSPSISAEPSTSSPTFTPTYGPTT